MNLQYYTLIGCILALLGCKTAPVASTQGNEPGQGMSPGTNRVQKSVPLDQQAFSVVATTNQLEAQWLRTPTNFFKLGPGDTIEIELLGEAASRASAVVGPDGKIYFGLLPGTFVWGLTLAETKKVLEEGLQKFFRDQPLIALTLRGVTSQRVWILGQVAAPGIYPLATPLTLLEAISLAGGSAAGGANAGGGANEGANAGAPEGELRNSFVMREGRLLGVDFYRLLQKGDLSQNIYLQADDFVYLKPGGALNVYVLGAVAKSGPVPFVDKVSLLGAVASAGSTVPYAQFSEVAIIRGSLTKPSLAKVNYRAITKGQAPDVWLEPGDIVYVPFSPFRTIGEIAEMTLDRFVRSVAISEGVRAVNSGTAPVGISIGLDGGLGVGPVR